MAKSKKEELTFQDVNDSFVEQIWQLTIKDINELKTIVIWIFQSTEQSPKKYFFIKNQLFGSNYREKIDGLLRYGGRFQFMEEVDVGEMINHLTIGQLTSDSWQKVFNKRIELKQKYDGEFAA